MILKVIIAFILLKFITASEVCCGSATRGQRLYVDVSSDSDFQLWLKMERKHTQVTLHVQGRGTNNEKKNFHQRFLWHNTEDYKGFPSNQNVTNRLGITNEVILSVGITATAPIELIVCRNSFSTTFPLRLSGCLPPAAAPPSPRSGPPLQDGLQDNIYEEWQERPAIATAAPARINTHKDNIQKLKMEMFQVN
ncbi:uncharacterized protein [Procambarus clarkii]|uniref:uncharacterized protein isoform X4 n=1 Tax=Procambarus clarkii TaxID=6728 RepID=UPI00374308D5